MGKVLLFIMFMLFSLPCVSAGQDKKDAVKLKVIRQHWAEFVRIVESGDCGKIKPHLANKINCYLCLENTDAEARALDELRETNKNWYDILYREKVFIPAATFCRQDVPIMFSTTMVKALRHNPTLFNLRGEGDDFEFVVAVTTTLPGEVAIMHEGGQHIFVFSKDLKLRSIFTVP